MMTLDELRAEVQRGAVDTVLLALTDMQGRLQGKRLTARHFIFVEYDTMLANPYVPYPIDWMHLEALLQSAGLKEIHRLADRPSAFGRVNLYAASAKHP